MYFLVLFYFYLTEKAIFGANVNQRPNSLNLEYIEPTP